MATARSSCTRPTPTLVALDAKTGKDVWTVKNGDPAKGETGTSAPMVVKDKVLIGISGGEFGVRGHITAYDIKTGKQAWRGYSEGPDAETLIDPEKTTAARQAGRQGFRHQAPGKATSGRSAAARPGAGSPTIRS